MATSIRGLLGSFGSCWAAIQSSPHTYQLRSPAPESSRIFTAQRRTPGATPTTPGADPGGGRIGTLLLNATYIQPGTVDTTGFYNHYSALRSYEDLLGARATPTTTQLVSMVIGSGRGRDLPAIIDRLVQRASSAKNLEVAEVRSAIALSEDQQTRLAAALANATGKQVNLKVVIDPSVLGGIVATVGDTVIDGSVRTTVDQLKARL